MEQNICNMKYHTYPLKKAIGNVHSSIPQNNINNMRIWYLQV